MPATNLNPEQKQAITAGVGPLLIIAGAGTGKTTVITKRIEHLILERNVSPKNILALTFTEKAATEMQTRIDEIMPYGYTDMWIETFHAFCDRILRTEAIHIGLTPRYTLMTEAESLLFLKKHLFDFNLTYFRPLGNPQKFLQGLLQHFSRLKDDDITPEQYLNYAKKLNPKPSTEQDDETKQILELAHTFKHYEDLKAQTGVMDFSDLISNVLTLFRTRKHILKKYQELFQYILVDEFQDTNFAQNEMAMLLAGEKQNITVVGDDDQCLPGETIITTPHERKQLKDIKTGEKIVTAVGKGSLGISTVNKVFKNKKKSVFLTITTKSGKTITATENHKMFCYIPKKVTDKKYHYVYLMHQKNLGWRLGTTSDLAVRLKLERSSDAIIGLRAFKTEDEARYHELIWSLTYQLPTCIFKERDGVILQGKLVERLYKVFDTEKNAKQLADDLGVNLSNYHYILDAVTRGQSKRIKIIVSQCYRNYAQKRIYSKNLMKNPLIAHEVRLETTNQEVIKKLDNNNIPYVKAKKGIRVRFSSADIKKVTDYAKKLAHITKGFIQMQSVIGTLQKVNMPAIIISASNLLEGLSVPIVKNNRVYYDEIVEIKREDKTEIVYDLEIDKTHNFIANDIVVHNSIYRWRGAAVSNMMQFRDHFPKATIVTLNKNYRSTQTILDAAYQMIQNNNPDRLEVKENINKKLTAQKNAVILSADAKRQVEGASDLRFIYANRGEDEAEEVAKIIKQDTSAKGRSAFGGKKYNYNDFAILVRANDHAIPFQRSLERAKIPYQFLGPSHLYQQDEIKDLIAYLHALVNFEDTASLYRVITMPIFDVSARDIAGLLNFSKRQNCSLFEAMERVTDTILTRDGKEKIARITDMFKKHLEKVPREQAGQILYDFFEDSGLLGHYLDPRRPRTEREAQNVAKFFDRLKSHASQHMDTSVFAVIDWLDMAMELGESPLAAEMDWTQNDAVNILTIHSSKGLEFPVVFVVNLVTQRFPGRDRKEQIPVPQDIIREELPSGDENLQEERRLFYVAATRAKEKLFLAASKFYGDGKRERKISPFITETLGKTAVEKTLKKHQTVDPGQQLSLLEVLNANIQEQDTPSASSGQTLDPKTSTPITYVSYSQLQTFLTCPLHYKLKYLLNVPTAPTPALSYGVSVHNTLRDFCQTIIDEQQIPSIETLLEQNWIKEGYTGKKHEEQSYKQAQEMLAKFAESYTAEKPKTVAIELPFNFWLTKTLKAGGKIDRIDALPDGRIEIIDYKTGRNVPTERKVKDDLQLSFYALAATTIKDPLLKRMPDEIVLTLHYLEADKKISTTRSAEALEKAREKILGIIDEITTSEFKCRGGMFCKTCEYAIVCQNHT